MSIPLNYTREKLTCPPSRVNALERCIALIEGASQSKFRVQSSGQDRDIYECLTFDHPEKSGIC
jgi:hypothetical protein